MGRVKVTGLQKTLAYVKEQAESLIQAKLLVRSSQLVGQLKGATPVDTGRARDGWKVERGRITNDVDYIDKLNAGSSAQAPSFFVESTLLSNTDVKPNGTIVTKKIAPSD